MVAGRSVIGGTYEDDMGCDDGCKTYILLLNFCLLFWDWWMKLAMARILIYVSLQAKMYCIGGILCEAQFMQTINFLAQQ